jgi:tRNA:m4X modification enzyme
MVPQKTFDDTPITTCRYFIQQKGRQCKIETVPGQEYCGIHIVDAGASSDVRVKCPYGNHTVLETQLRRHMKKCNDFRVKNYWQNHPCCVKGINLGSHDMLALPDAPPDLADSKGRVDTLACRRSALASRYGPDRFQDLLERINRLTKGSSQLSTMDKQSVQSPPGLERFLDAASLDERRHNPKHVTQQASIVGNMACAGLLRCPEQSTFVEFGAGTGYLTCMLADCFHTANELVMMDVRSFKFIADRSLRDRNMKRLRCDVADFYPAGLESIRNGAPWVAYGKHLCGSVTDLALRCAMQKDSRPGLLGIAIATCCHHRCEWQNYVGTEVLQDLGFSREDFELISYMTGWALCGHDSPVDLDASTSDDVGAGTRQQVTTTTTTVTDDGPSLWRPHHLLTRQDRIKIGQYCKKILDYGRLEWLRRHDCISSSVTYVPSNVTGESRLILATS